MLNFLKRLFGKKEQESYTPDPPGRTFKRVPTSQYFEGESPKEDLESIDKAKLHKIEQIKALELQPKFLRYIYKNKDEEIKAVHVVFQKERFDEKWNMVHITEISFSVLRQDFKEFQTMAGVNLETDFRDLTTINNDTFRGEEKRKEERKYFK